LRPGDVTPEDVSHVPADLAKRAESGCRRAGLMRMAQQVELGRSGRETTAAELA
jgi:hypothetical protein